MEQRFEDILKDGLEKCIREKGIKDFSTATPIERGKSLTEFYIKEIGQFLYQIYEDDIEDSIVDGKGDLGIDFIYNRDGEWVILQSKYKGQSSNITLDEVSGFLIFILEYLTMNL